MTTDPRRALAALALVPVTAGAFAGAVAWAADQPTETAADVQPEAVAPPASVVAPVAAQPVPAAEPAAAAASSDPRDAAVAAQLEVLRTRLADLQAELTARQAQAASAAQAAAEVAASSRTSSGSSGSSTTERSAPAPRPAPPVDTTTRASG